MVVLNVETEDGQHEALRRMLTIRAFDTKTVGLFSDGELLGFVHLYVGEETVGAGACSALESDDYITGTHEGHDHCIVRGLDPGLMMVESFGRADGYCNGKGKSVHTTDIDAGMLGANGIVGAGPPLTMGAAFASYLKGEDAVALTFFDDDAVVQGQVHEAVNLAATWSLPTVFLVENNQYGEATPVEKRHNIQNLSKTAEAYNIPGFTADGMGIIVVYEAVKGACKWAAGSKGPTLIEAETCRYHGHFEGNQQPYRIEEDVAIWKDRDVTETFKRRLVDTGTIAEAEFDETKVEIDQQIEDAIGKAKNATYPDPSEAYEDMFGAAVPEASDSSSGIWANGGENR